MQIDPRRRIVLSYCVRPEMDEPFDRAEVEIPFGIRKSRILVELTGDQSMAFGIGRDQSAFRLEPHQSVCRADPQAAFLVGQNLEHHVAGHSVLHCVMDGLAGLEVVFDDTLERGKPHVPVRILTNIVDEVMPLGIQLVVRKIHPGVADRVVIETAVEHARPDAAQAVFVDTADRISRKLGRIAEAVVQIIVFEHAIVGAHINLSFAQDLDTTHRAVLRAGGIFEQAVSLDHFPALDIHLVDPMDDMSDPQIIVGSRQTADIGMGNPRIVRSRLIVREERSLLVQAVDAGIFGADPDISQLVCTNIADHFPLHGVGSVVRIIDTERLERRAVIDSVLVETDPDALFTIPVKGRDILARQGIRIARVLLYPMTFSGIDLIDDEA
ncbi:unknown [Parabacteroides sp. CAG:409]|nr:unknown [Parabacteroides sp. CAG:409]